MIVIAKAKRLEGDNTYCNLSVELTCYIAKLNVFWNFSTDINF